MVSDELLIELIRENNDQAYNIIVAKYASISFNWLQTYSSWLNYVKTSPYYLKNYILQGLFIALDLYVPSMGYFYPYYRKKVAMMVGSYIKSVTSNKCKALTFASSLDESIKDDSCYTYKDYVQSNCTISQPVEIYECKETKNKIIKDINSMNIESKLIIKMRYNGFTNNEIANKLQISAKRVEYILGKVKKKLTTLS